MIGSIENAITKRLRAASDAGLLGYKYRTLLTSPAQWDVMIKEQQGTINMPAAWVVFAGMSRTSSDEGNPYFIFNYFLVVMAENQRNEEEFRRHGDALSAGTYQLISDAMALLGNAELHEDWGNVKLGNVRFVAAPQAKQENKVSIMALALSIEAPGPEPINFDGDISDFDIAALAWDASGAQTNDIIILNEEEAA